MGVNIATIAYLRVLIIELGSTIMLMVVEAQGQYEWLIFMVHVGKYTMVPWILWDIFNQTLQSVVKWGK